MAFWPLSGDTQNWQEFLNTTATEGNSPPIPENCLVLDSL
jgi:hypothetical protein